VTNPDPQPTAAPGGVPPRVARLAPEELLRRLDLQVSRKVDGMLHGDYLGLVPGHGSEPGDAREYVPGDDVRRIDWNVTARTQEPYVRDTVADRELEAWVVIDLSPSLAFGTAQCEKRDLAIAVAATVGFLTARLGNRIGAVVVQADGSNVTIQPRTGRNNLMALLHKLVDCAMNMPQAASRADGGTNLAAGIRHARRVARRRGLVVVVSDFLTAPGWERELRSLTSHHEVLAAEVLDPRELELPAVGVLRVVDPETGRELEVQTNSPKLRARYAEAAQAQRAEIAAAIRSAGVEHLVVRTDGDFVGDVVRFVERRKARRAGAARANGVLG
jgi:uncharacterized protein (DUF58 family)